MAYQVVWEGLCICRLHDALCSNLQVCGVSVKSGSYPVPLVPVSDITSLAEVSNASYAVHDQLQHEYHTTFVVG